MISNAGILRANMERNVALYPAYQVAGNLLFWMPVFFLYFSSVLPVDEVLLLEAIYYVGVVALEVPSGYFSDRIGRRATLLVAALAWALAGAVFALTASFAWFALAQVLLATGMAFNSGTDSALLYDSLRVLGREGEIGDVEGRAGAAGFVALAVSTLVGGAAAGLDLRIAYALSAVAGVAALVVAWQFCEPLQRESERAAAPLRQLAAVVGQLRDPVLRWTFAFTVAMIVVVHIPYEFFQPYVDAVLGGASGGGLLGGAATADYAHTPLVTGALLAASMLPSAWTSARAMALARWLGAGWAMLGSMVFVLAIIAAMAAVVHPAVLALVVMRSATLAATKPIANAAVHPRLAGSMRATYLSVQSLFGRLAFASALALAARTIGAHGSSGSWSDIADVLFVGAGVGAVACGALAVLIPRALRRGQME